MIQNYFNHYEKMISPREYNQATLIKNLNKKKINQIKIQDMQQIQY